MGTLLLGKYDWVIGQDTPVGSGYAYTFKSTQDVDVFCKQYLSEHVSNIVQRIYSMNKKTAIRFEWNGEEYVPHHNPPEDYRVAGLKIIQFKQSRTQRTE